MTKQTSQITAPTTASHAACHTTSSATLARQLCLTLALGLSLWGCPDADPPGAVDMGSSDDMRMSFTFDFGGVEAGVTTGGEAGTIGGVEAGTIGGTASGTTAGSTPEESCTSCEDSSDCADGESCVEMNEAGEGRCFFTCGIEDGAGDETGCPDGFACTTLSAELSVCVSSDSDVCEPYCYDQDGDGFGVGEACSGNRDCNDNDPTIFQGAADLCDGLDNDCDGNLDEDFTPTSCGEGACAAVSSCAEGVEVQCVPGAPAAEDITCDGLDDDCDARFDEDYEPISCGFGLCASESSCLEGQERSCEPSAAQTTDDLSCDGVDDDCDGNVDEDFSESCGEGLCVAFAVCSQEMVSCQPREPDPLDTDAQCDGIDSNCNGTADEGFDPASVPSCGVGVCERQAVCAAGAISCTPGVPLAATDETCDGVDDDCDGEIDEECQVNTMSASYNASESTSDLVAIDIYYVQDHSPLHDGVEWQPTTMNIAVNFPAGMTPHLNLIEGQAFRTGPAVIAAQKIVDGRLTATVPNQVQYTISTTAIGGDVQPIAPADPSDPSSALLLTVYFDTNGVSSPWVFSWDEQRTSMAPELARGALDFASIEVISP